MEFNTHTQTKRDNLVPHDNHLGFYAQQQITGIQWRLNDDLLKEWIGELLTYVDIYKKTCTDVSIEPYAIHFLWSL